MHSTETAFFTVSLADNIGILKITIPLINRYYDSPPFSVICPDRSAGDFEQALCGFANVNIVPESSLISLAEFRSIADTCAAAAALADYGPSRLSWYYQQVLKLTFLLRADANPANMVMWDADTVPLRRIEFFHDADTSVLYGSRIEFHQPYFNAMQLILHELPRMFAAFTVQFFSCTRRERAALDRNMKRFLPMRPGQSVGAWVAEVILTSVLASHRTLIGSGFSEQELVGLSNMLASGAAQEPLRYLRWELKGRLSELQMRVLRRLGFAHVTYESHAVFLNKKQKWTSLVCRAVKSRRLPFVLHHWPASN